MNIFELIEKRRSLGRMRPEAPPRELIERLLAAAVHAPNHHNTQPWRFFVLTGDARAEFGSVLAEALRHRLGPDVDAAKLEPLLAGERAKPLRSPVVIVVGVVTDKTNRMTAREDLQAASAAISNLLLAAETLGLAAIWRTGDGAYDDAVKPYFGLAPEDQIAGVVYVGYADPNAGSIEPRRREFASKTEWRGNGLSGVTSNK
ncbi:MAG TPA: nitroreductase [Dehalococcoidia bacterium]|nr:nitroreductase [Dehalococcoidia bacterium]